MIKVIFLDIDGVLNVYCEGRDKYGCCFHKHLEENLKYIVESTGAKIVITSTWRMSGLKTMKDMWKHRNLAGQVIDITAVLDDIRGVEIQKWLDKNRKRVSNYVIIDDDDDMLDSQMNNYVKTSDNSNHEDCVDIGYGLTRICAEKAIKILNR